MNDTKTLSMSIGKFNYFAKWGKERDPRSCTTPGIAVRTRNYINTNALGLLKGETSAVNWKVSNVSGKGNKFTFQDQVDFQVKVTLQPKSEDARSHFYLDEVLKDFKTAVVKEIFILPVFHNWFSIELKTYLAQKDGSEIQVGTTFRYKMVPKESLRAVPCAAHRGFSLIPIDQGVGISSFPSYNNLAELLKEFPVNNAPTHRTPTGTDNPMGLSDDTLKNIRKSALNLNDYYSTPLDPIKDFPTFVREIFNAAAKNAEEGKKKE